MKNQIDKAIRYPICSGLELEATSSEDSRKVNICIGNHNEAIYFEPNKKQLQRLIRHLKEIENNLKG